MLFKNIGESKHSIQQAAELLTEVFCGLGKDAWPDYESAEKEVYECLESPNICFGVFEEDTLLGWIGLRPMYDISWELHPLVVRKDMQGKRIGQTLIFEAEKRASEQGIIGIILGTDDETQSTSLSAVDLDGKNCFDEIQHVHNFKRHPYEFYQKCGYSIVGVIPDANGKRKPDILMWKSLVENA